MGKRKRKHKQAVAEGKKAPFRASPDKPKVSIQQEPSTSDKLMERVRRLKEQKGG